MELQSDITLANSKVIEDSDILIHNLQCTPLLKSNVIKTSTWSMKRFDTSDGIKTNSLNYCGSPVAPFMRINCRELSHTAVVLPQFLPCQLGPSATNLFITCCSDCTTRNFRMLHISKPVKPSASVNEFNQELKLFQYLTWPDCIVFQNCSKGIVLLNSISP